MNNFALVLEMLLRMRQAADSPALVPTEFRTAAFLRGMGVDPKHEARKRLLAMLRETDVECNKCSKIADRAVITPCAHYLCSECMSQAQADQQSDALTVSANPTAPSLSSPSFSTSNSNSSISSTVIPSPSSLATSAMMKCPLCDMTFSRSALVLADDFVQSGKDDEKHRRSQLRTNVAAADTAKVRALLGIIASLQPGEKIVIFSQFTAMLDIVEGELTRRRVGWVRLDGGMSNPARQRAIRAFQEDTTSIAFLISLKAGGVGLNLTAANTVVLLDPWWNPAAEQQAVDRIHRVGQTRDVTVVHLIAVNTVEQRIVELQKKKLAMMTAAMTRDSAKQQKLDELKDLFR